MKYSLKEHLHTPECISLIREYKKCHQENKFMKFLGVCNNIEAEADKCIQEELRMKRAMNKFLKGPRRPNVIKKEVEETD